MKAIAKSNRNLIMLLAGLIILLLVYFMVFTNIQDQTESIYSELNTQNSFLSELQNFKQNESEYLQTIDAGKKTVADLTAVIPADVPAEDVVLYLIDLEKKTGVTVSDISVEDKLETDTFDCIVNGEEKNVTGGVVASTINAQMEYEQLKEMLDYIYESKDATFVNAISVAYDSTTGLLSATVDLSKLYMNYDGASYTGMSMPMVEKGVVDLFGTITFEEPEADEEVAVDGAEEAEEAEEAEQEE